MSFGQSECNRVKTHWLPYLSSLRKQLRFMKMNKRYQNFNCKALVSPFNPFALGLNKALLSFGQSGCNRVKIHWLALSIVKLKKTKTI